MSPTPTSQDVARLLNEASRADDQGESARLISEAQQAQSLRRAAHAQDREVDLAQAVVRERLAPVTVHQRHTSATDWLAAMDTSADLDDVSQRMTAQAALWYGRISPQVKADATEFAEQAQGYATHLAGAYGEHSKTASQTFTDQVTSLRTRDVSTGVIKEAAAAPPQVANPGVPADFATGNYANALPPEATTSERAGQIQELEHNTGASQTPSAEQATGEPPTGQDTSMTNQRQAARHQAYSGLPQIQQVVNNSDTGVEPTPMPEEVAFPWVISPNDVNQTISQAEQQIAERDQRKGAARVAAQAAQQVFAEQMRAQGWDPKEAGYDASGWAGDMGAGGYGPGQQDVQGAPGTNLGMPDPVYGEGGDQGDRPLKPYGASEANDKTNNPDEWAPGQPAQMDLGGRQMSTSSRHAQDPEIQQALKFIAQRQAWLDEQQ